MRDTVRETAVKKMYGKDLEIHTKLDNPQEPTVVELTFITPTKKEYKLTEYLTDGMTTHFILEYKRNEKERKHLIHNKFEAEYSVMALISEE